MEASSSPSTTQHDTFEARLQQRIATTMSDRSLEMSTANPGTHVTHGGRLPNTPLTVSTISFLLGSLFTLGLSTFLAGGANFWWTTPQLSFFAAAWAAFHWAEFAVTAGWNRGRCNVDSFLLDNGIQYHIAHSFAVFEYLATLYFAPSWKAYPYISEIGIILVIASQALRSAAMITAASNFSHAVAYRKAQGHQLVTSGIYAWFRHPSYAGFFYWALGSQLVMQNPISFVGFAVVIWRFFNQRVQYEERALVSFFGKNYEEYRARVGTMIPFIR